MIGGLLARIAGPRVLLGVAVVALAAIATLGLMLKSAWEGQAEAFQAAAQYRQSLNATNQELDRLMRERANLEQALKAQAQARREAERRASTLLSDIRELEHSSDEIQNWSGTPVPSAVVERLREQPAAGSNPDGED